ncbi:unnamed protein product [Cuscuta europaea]|uniref:HVA22-like protein n=1 Tax=Cuscuta europaea TaxID=41803 RepID=A0A9P0ZAB4_CUSEU|nr:unnamed protein product [Cuscuta europaea]
MGRRRSNDDSLSSLLQAIVVITNYLALPIISIVYPLYLSTRAVYYHSRDDVERWLTFWLLHFFIAYFEMQCPKFVELIWGWDLAKLLVMCWLVLPFFKGTERINKRLIRPIFERYTKDSHYAQSIIPFPAAIIEHND